MSVPSAVTDALLDAAGRADLARAALAMARVEYPNLDPAPYLAQLDAMGEAARQGIQAAVDVAGRNDAATRIAGLNSYLFDQERFVGNSARYEDPRNSCLNEVLDRRTGIPITLSLVFMEVGRRAGVAVEGVNFPGHFLVRCLEGSASGVILDPFHAGAALSERDCRRLLERYNGADAAFSRQLLAPATATEFITRMLLNLKRAYVQMRSLPQARDVTELLLALSPSALSELRDRGLIALHLNDLASALRDIESYLQLSRLGASAELDDDAKEEREQLWEHVKTLRRRTASLN